MFRSPIGVTFIRARKNVGKRTNLGTRVLEQFQYIYEVVNATIKQIDSARQDIVSHSSKVFPSAMKTLLRDNIHKFGAPCGGGRGIFTRSKTYCIRCTNGIRNKRTFKVNNLMLLFGQLGHQHIANPTIAMSNACFPIEINNRFAGFFRIYEFTPQFISANAKINIAGTMSQTYAVAATSCKANAKKSGLIFPP